MSEKSSVTVIDGCGKRTIQVFERRDEQNEITVWYRLRHCISPYLLLAQATVERYSSAVNVAVGDWPKSLSFRNTDISSETERILSQRLSVF